jgi:hypothetical protein
LGASQSSRYLISNANYGRATATEGDRINSDILENQFAKAREYAADLRFAPAGPRPPVPPVGGKIYFNDAANTINKITKCSQSFSSDIINKQNIKTTS